MFDYVCFDFVLRSAIALPELALLSAPSPLPTVAIHLGAVQSTANDATGSAGGIQVAGDVVTLTVPAVARYRMSGGREIVVDAEPGCSDRNVRLFLLGSALGILCLQRGLMLLHANAIVVDGRAAGFGGPSGAGKSTLASFFARAGYRVLCDDVCGITFDPAGKPLIWPGLPRLKLWGDAAVAHGYDPLILERVIDSADKYHVPLVTAEPHAPLPFGRFYVLDRTDEGHGEIVRLRGSDAVKAVMENSYRPEYRAPLGLVGQTFTQSAALLAQIPVYRATRRWGFDFFDDAASRLERHLAAG